MGVFLFSFVMSNQMISIEKGQHENLLARVLGITASKFGATREEVLGNLLIEAGENFKSGYPENEVVAIENVGFIIEYYHLTQPELDMDMSQGPPILGKIDLNKY
jgi:hypothetical protein